MIVRRATREDFREFYGCPPPVTLRGLVGVTSTGPIGFGGYYLRDGVAVVFSDHRPFMRKRDIVKGARAIMAQISELPFPVTASAGKDGTAALEHFGFVPFGQFYRYAP